MNRSSYVFAVLLALLANNALLAQSRTNGTDAKQESENKEKAKKKVYWHNDLRSAHREAVKLNKPILVVFGAKWCSYCRKLERTTLSNPGLERQIKSSFVAAALDLDKEKRIAKILEVRSVPCTIVLSPQADLLGKLVGYVEPQRYQHELKKALKVQTQIRQARKSKSSVRE